MSLPIGLPPPASSADARRDPHPSTKIILETMVTLGGIQAAAMVFNLIRSKVAAVALGTVGVGAISVIDQVTILIAQLAAFSLPVAGIKFLSAAHSESHAEFAALYSALFRALLLLSLAGTVLAAACLAWKPEILGAELERYRWIALLGLIAIPATNLTVLLTNTMAASKASRASALFGLAGSILLAATCSVGIATAGIRGYYLANFAATGALVLGGIVYLRKRQNLNIGGFPDGVHVKLRRHARILKFSAAMYATSFSSPLSDLLVRYAVLLSGGLSTTGLFQAASGMGLMLRSILRPSFSLFLTPALNRKGTTEQKALEAAMFFRVLSLLLGIAALPIVLFPSLWMSLLYSKAFEPAASGIYLFVLGVGVQLLAAVNVALLLGLDDIRAYVWTSVGADAATALLAWFLAPRLGLSGVGLAFILDGAVVFSFSSSWLWRRHGVSIRKAIGWMPPSIVAILAGAGMLSSRPGIDTAGVIVLKCGLLGAFVLCFLKLVRSGDEGLARALRR
ncbi:MAG TPA: hypothetical protein VG273_08785 [Bryobacteraceae bacterium]|nr:hypothetical protein [Bryobacteraceae bacterium]